MCKKNPVFYIAFLDESECLNVCIWFLLTSHNYNLPLCILAQENFHHIVGNGEYFWCYKKEYIC